MDDIKNSAPPSEVKSIFSLTYKEYEHIGYITELNVRIRDMLSKLDDATKILKKQNEYVNFRAINKEVQVVEKSKLLPDFPLDIMLERKG